MQNTSVLIKKENKNEFVYRKNTANYWWYGFFW